MSAYDKLLEELGGVDGSRFEPDIEITGFGESSFEEGSTDENTSVETPRAFESAEHTVGHEIYVVESSPESPPVEFASPM